MNTTLLPSAMKNLSRKLACLVSLILFFGNTSFAQTNVSGGIYVNTTWTKVGSPYIVTDTVMIFSGITLTIQPGVVVKYNNNGFIDAQGNLYANGTPTDSIIFTSNSATPHAGICRGIQIGYSNNESFNYCRFSYAYSGIGANYNTPIISHCLFTSDLYGISAWDGSIDTCVFKYDSVAINGGWSITGCVFIKNGAGAANLQGPLLNCIFRNNIYGVTPQGGYISHCTFDSNYGAIYGGGADSIENCIIQNNYFGIAGGAAVITLNDISDNAIGIETGGGNISCNTICNNTHYNIIDGNSSSFNFSVKDNYWCLTDSAHIQATIYDAYQNINLGFVYFTPFDTVPCITFSGCNLMVSATATNTVVCAGNSTTLTAQITDLNPVYTAVWNPGNHTGTSFTVKPLAKTTYTVVVTDSSGCKDSAYITIDTSCVKIPCSLTVSATATNTVVCAGNPTTLTAYVTDKNSVYTAVWNPGNHTGTSYTVTPLANTTYTVVVTDSSGCKDSAYITIDTLCTSHPCTLTVSASATSDSICAGSSTTLICSVTDNSSYTYSIPFWTPGNYRGNTYTVKPTVTTTYTVIDSDNNGCKKTVTITIKVTPIPTVTISPIPAKLCSNAAPITLSGTPAGGTFYGTGVVGNTFYPSLASGNVLISYLYSSACGYTSSSDVTYVASPQSPPSICYVTSDTSSTFNTVVWQKAGLDTLAIDSIIIYRQNVIGNFVPIGEVSVHGHTKFNDLTARLLVEPYFYALGVTDTCGGDTLLSNINETVFLQSVATSHTAANLSWNFYQGAPVLYYRILRDDSGTGNWHAIDSVQGTINAYTDRNAPVNPGLRYMLNTDWNVLCTPSIIKPRQSRHFVFNTDNEAYSNMSYVFPTGIANLFNNNSINLFPNPVTNMLSISFNQSFKGSVTITDVLGQEVYSNSRFTSEKGSTKEIDLSGVKSGVYIITLQSGDGTLRKKIIKI